MKAVDLRAGDRLQLVNGEYVTVEQVQHEILESPITVYNFRVADNHTYYVGDSSNAVLVHNMNCLDTDSISRAVSDTSRLQHAYKHADKLGFGKWNKSSAKQWKEFIQDNLKNYTKTFSNKLGKDPVIGYYRYSNGMHIATYIYTAGKQKGLVATVVKLSSNQLKKFGLD